MNSTTPINGSGVRAPAGIKTNIGEQAESRRAATEGIAHHG